MTWTSNLSVKEWLLLKQIGMEPITQVMGSCVYHTGYMINKRFSNSWGNEELDYLMEPYEEARKSALDRMSKEARASGADAVVDVKFLATPGPAGTHPHLLEFSVIGTAVRIKGLDRSYSQPLLCTVSMQELVQLVHAGAMPVGLAMGLSIYHHFASEYEERKSRSFYNQELTSFSSIVNLTRQSALRRLKENAHQYGANVVLAHRTEFRVIEAPVTRASTLTGELEIERKEDKIFEFTALGTAVQYDKNYRFTPPKGILDLRRVINEPRSNDDIEI
ncbi:heavy metal-binding domain-containing protein [Alicyclobacillus sp. SO9]|uniref:heavy metal-binding domain-containing protein n=1 Tax=Alicyclobacillus sp. SO9 TaxID=2665646 RepID=UPI0018E79617|nr:heavy metal-binding domain-containing protein [Alicyclobacillus sp. SO9]QQE76867.1 heavy metal-binding domain-containing protein [Alicyclobacillus sp. SO9]